MILFLCLLECWKKVKILRIDYDVSFIGFIFYDDWKYIIGDLEEFVGCICDVFFLCV